MIQILKSTFTSKSSKFKFSSVILLCCLAVGGVTSTFASKSDESKSEELTNIAEARRGYYKLLGVNMGILAAMAKGEIDYDVEIAKTQANNMMTLAKYSIGGLYPAGSSNKDLPGKTRALPSIWSDFAGVQEKGGEYYTALEYLVKNVGSSKEDLQSSVQKLGATCKGCHDDYRAKDL